MSPPSTPAATTPASEKEKGGTTTTEKTDDQKIDITSDAPTAADTNNNNNNNDNYALANPATQSTYQRVDKGTRTALIYWDGWLTAEDAKLAEDDKSYYGKSGQKPQRNTNLKKNWTYGKNGEIIYIATGFVGVFDKGNRSTYGNNSSYANVSNYGKSNSPLPKNTGPSVGTAWDLHGNPLNRSAYIDITSTRGGSSGKASSGGGNQDANYFGKSDAKSDVKRNPNLTKNWTYGKNGEIVYIPTGFKGLFDKPAPGVSPSSHGASSGSRSSYSNFGPSGTSSCTSSPGSSYGTVSKKRDKHGGGKSVATDDDFFGKSDAKSEKKITDTVKKNWKYGTAGEIVYIPTGFVGSMDKNRSASNTGSSYGTLSNNNSCYGGVKSSTPKKKSNNRSQYGDVKK